MQEKNKKISVVFFYSIVSLTLIFVGAVVFGSINAISQSEMKSENKLADQQIQASSSTDEVNNLIIILKDKSLKEKSPQMLVDAIKRLGSIKSTKAIPELLEYLDFEVPLESKESYSQPSDGVEINPSIPVSGRYPAVGALIQIGKVALPKLTEAIENEEITSTKSQNAVYSIQQIFRDDLLNAIKYLENAGVNSTSQNGKQRLSSTVKKLKLKRN